MKIKKTKKGFEVESSSRKGEFYLVDPDKPWCDCPAYRFRALKKGGVCKHITAVREHLKELGIEAGDSAPDPSEEVLAYLRRESEVDSIILIERFGEEVIDRLISQGVLLEKRGKIRLLE